MAGLYDAVFGASAVRGVPEMDEWRTNGHWKREQDNYLSQIGAMDKINKDPMSKLGYSIRSAGPDRTLTMGGSPNADHYGDYTFTPTRETLDDLSPRADGTLQVDVGLASPRYAKTLTHELGHVGSRNSGTDRDYMASGDNEEMSRRFRDILLWPPGHPGHEDAKAFLAQNFNIPEADAEEVAKNYLGVMDKAPKPTKRPEKKAAKKKKKKTLLDLFD